MHDPLGGNLAQFLKDLVHYNKGFFQFDALFGVEDIKIRDKSYNYNELAEEIRNKHLPIYEKAIARGKEFDLDGYSKKINFIE